jgi:hypothetical protein
LAPLLEAGIGRFQGRVEIGLSRMRVAAYGLAGCRIDDGHRVAVLGRSPATVDQQIYVEIRWSFVKHVYYSIG